jgi:hypothetical protein
MKCSACGTENQEASRFCGACGKPLVVASPRPANVRAPIGAPETRSPAPSPGLANAGTPIRIAGTPPAVPNTRSANAGVPIGTAGSPTALAVVEGPLADLQSDRAKKRESACHALARLDVSDERIVRALETLAYQDEVAYVRTAASEALLSPVHQVVAAGLRDSPVDEKTLEQRRAILDWAVSQRIQLGYRLIARSDTTAQLVKPKSFNTGFALLCVLMILLFGIGLVLLIIYFIMYSAQKEDSIYLEVDGKGMLKVSQH